MNKVAQHTHVKQALSQHKHTVSSFVNIKRQHFVQSMQIVLSAGRFSLILLFVVKQKLLESNRFHVIATMDTLVCTHNACFCQCTSPFIFSIKRMFLQHKRVGREAA